MKTAPKEPRVFLQLIRLERSFTDLHAKNANKHNCRMKIKAVQGRSITQIQDEISQGGKFVQYTWCISLFVVTYRYQSPVYFLRGNQHAFCKGLPYTILTLLLGWWGIPYGPFYTLTSVYNNIEGKCVTASVMKRLYQQTRGHVFDFETTAPVAYA